MMANVARRVLSGMAKVACPVLSQLATLAKVAWRIGQRGQGGVANVAPPMARDNLPLLTPNYRAERVYRCEACGLMWRYDSTGARGADAHERARDHPIRIVTIPVRTNPATWPAGWSDE
jgi:hypothetical protein